MADYRSSKTLAFLKYIHQEKDLNIKWIESLVTMHIDGWILSQHKLDLKNSNMHIDRMNCLIQYIQSLANMHTDRVHPVIQKIQPFPNMHINSRTRDSTITNPPLRGNLHTDIITEKKSRRGLTFIEILLSPTSSCDLSGPDLRTLFFVPTNKLLLLDLFMGSSFTSIPR